MRLMSCLGSTIDIGCPLVLDTSVLINIFASGFPDDVLGAIPNVFLVPDTVAREIRREPEELALLDKLFELENVVSTSMASSEEVIFTTLVTGSGSLDDGEAATIAIAIGRDGTPVIDERKGRRVFEGLRAKTAPYWSLDLLHHDQVVRTLGVTRSTDAVYNALRDGRMRICETQCDRVVTLIGAERALHCTSLPGYKNRKAGWQHLLRSNKS